MDNAPEPGAVAIAFEVLALPAVPAAPALEPQLAAIAATSGSAFRGASSLPPDSRFASPPPDLAAGRRVGAAAGVVGPGLRVVATSSHPHLAALACEAEPSGLRLWLRTADGERCLLRPPLQPHQPAMVFVPATGTGGGHAFVVTLGGAAEAGALAQAHAAVRDAADLAPLPSRAERQWQEARTAYGAYSRRAALLALAAASDLPACTDVLLAADEARLAAIGDEVGRLDAAATTDPWAFERALWTALVPALQRDELPPGLRAAVIRRLGALTAEPTLLRVHLRQSADASAFAAALHAENVYALTDRDAIHRIRAHDWLALHGVQIDGYDPLADDAARDRALAAWQATRGER